MEAYGISFLTALPCLVVMPLAIPDWTPPVPESSNSHKGYWLFFIVRGLSPLRNSLVGRNAMLRRKCIVLEQWAFVGRAICGVLSMVGTGRFAEAALRKAKGRRA